MSAFQLLVITESLLASHFMTDVLKRTAQVFLGTHPGKGRMH